MFKTKFARKTLKFKLSLISLIMILVIAAVTLLLSNLFLKSYYYRSKQQAVIDAFDYINSIYIDGLENDNNSNSSTTGVYDSNSLAASDDGSSAESGVSPDVSSNIPGSSDDASDALEEYDQYAYLSDDLELQIEQISANQNIAVIIYRDIVQNPFGQMLYPNTKLLLYSSLGNNQESQVESSNIYSDYVNSNELKDSVGNSVKTSDYTIKQVNIKRLGSSYMYLDGQFQNGDHVLLRTSVAVINESVNWSNKFYMYITLAVGCVAFVIMYFICGKFLAPITELNTIAGKMSELDFTTKYEVRSQDEVGELGTSINVLSENLEKTLGELKEANAQLMQDIQEKDRIDAMRKEFLSNVSHELKTPIALIQGYAEGLADNINDDEESREFYCEVIMDEAKKMNNMVKKIIALNQLEFGYGNVTIEHFDISEIISSVLNKSGILIQQKEAKIVKNIQPQMVWSDAYIAEEVFTNYFTNALNHLDYDRKIVITTEKHDDTVRVSVFNTGDPIPETDIGKIWEKFYKVDKARTREYGGSGVGLSIVKASMELLGQQYGVRNEENGVTFWFDLDCKNS